MTSRVKVEVKEFLTENGVYRCKLYKQDSQKVCVFSSGLSVDAERVYDIDCVGRTSLSIALDNGYDVMTLDLLGYGMSDPSPEVFGKVYSLREILKDFETISKWISSNYSKMLQVSFSMQTTVWSRWAVANLGIMQASIYLSPNQGSASIPHSYLLNYINLLNAITPFPKGRVSSLETLRKRIEWSQSGKLDMIHPNFWEKMKQRTTELTNGTNTWGGPTQILAELMLERINGIHNDSYEKHTWPVLMFHGEKEPDTPISMIQKIMTEVQNENKQFYIIPESSHFYIWEKNQEIYLQKFEDFIKSL